MNSNRSPPRLSKQPSLFTLRSAPASSSQFITQLCRVALSRRGIPYENKKKVGIHFEDAEVGIHELDLLVEGQIVVELKAIKALEDVHFAQVRSYLCATDLRVGLLMNFYAREANCQANRAWMSERFITKT